MLIMVSKFSREALIPHIACVRVKSLVYMKMVIFGIILKKHLIKIYTKTLQIAPFFKIFSEELALEHLRHAQHMHIYTSGKIICMPLLNPVMYAHLSLFVKNHNKKGPLFPIFKWSTSIHKNNPT